MKNIVLSAVAVLAMSSFAVAGGDIAPIEEPIVEEVVVVENLDAGFYLGLGYSFLNATIDEELVIGRTTLSRNALDESFSDIMIQAGYKFNAYVAIEGRYWFGLDTSTRFFGDDRINSFDDDVSVDAWGIYVKPMYPIGENFEVYALLGYGAADMTIDNLPGHAEYTTDSIDGFSWGIGAEYEFSNNIAVFVDYVSIYDDTTSIDNGVWDGVVFSSEVERKIDTVNVGVSYKF